MYWGNGDNYNNYNNFYDGQNYNNGYNFADNDIEIYEREVYHCIERYAVRRNSCFTGYENGGCSCSNCQQANMFINNF